MLNALPPGPRQPRALQTVAWWTRPVSFLESNRRRYGKRFTMRLLQTPAFVMLSDPDEIREVFTAPPDVLHPGEGARILEPVVGRNSVILLDEGAHLEQRKLMLPAFHGERMQRLSGLMTEVAEREAAGWPRERPVELHPLLQGLTLEVILRAVFGLDPGARMDAIRERLTKILALGARPLGMLPFMQKDLGGRGPWAYFVRLREETDRLLFELIDERRADSAERDDVLAMLLAARHEDGSPMTDRELRDELMTLLVAGHETTASELAWAFERLLRAPAVMARLVDEVDSGDGDAYLTATIHEALRRRPVLPNAAPRLVKQPVTIGGFDYPEGVCLVPNAYLVHHDPALYPDPYAFRPERFLDEGPGTYTWIPFGGGRRRCLGASFALVEMKIVLRAVLAGNELSAPYAEHERSRRRAITLSPRRGATTVLRARPRVREEVPAAA
ncbi:MAG: cytochrome P450 [Thermoleophilaceae bacterium]|nr:cytochrome P450 [Thermoleophilaceae bacterium]